MVFWRTEMCSDTDYIMDFERQARDFKSDDDVAVDMDIEEWNEEDYICVVYSTQLWGE